MGLPPTNAQARKACAILLDRGLHEDGGISFGWRGGSETCVTGMVLPILSYFELDDARLDTIADHLLGQQMPDGGWNCQRPQGATAHRRNKLAAVRAAQRRGREFLLEHRLFRSHRTGSIIQSVFLRFSFPPRWHYDVLRALDYFQAVNATRDKRLSEAIQHICDKQRKDGRWALENRHKGKTWFELERPGAPSRWNTLRSMRVQKWWKENPAIRLPSQARLRSR